MNVPETPRLLPDLWRLRHSDDQCRKAGTGPRPRAVRSQERNPTK
jgi:hypothetical protein